jgi:formylglycine-generating enzyme required for sulfatase activity
MAGVLGLLGWLLAASPAVRPVWADPATGIAFVSAPAGRFVMGSLASESGRNADEAPHEVELSPFWIARDETTQALWRRVMGRNPSHFGKCGDACPVENVTWFEVGEFLARLNRLSPGRNYRLPTEAQWEYACRAGTSTPFSTGSRLTVEQANFDGRYPLAGHPPGRFRGSPVPAGSFPANSWGLRDLHGNVWEWCEDAYGTYPAGPARDPSWAFDENSCRCALRYTHEPGDRGFSIGFRVVADAPRAGSP